MIAAWKLSPSVRPSEPEHRLRVRRAIQSCRPSVRVRVLKTGDSFRTNFRDGERRSLHLAFVGKS